MLTRKSIFKLLWLNLLYVQASEHLLETFNQTSVRSSVWLVKDEQFSRKSNLNHISEPGLGLSDKFTKIDRRQKADDYSCTPTSACKNGACCGAGNFCGYGPKYCGIGCTSNCHATAECGRFSSPPGKTCPLNTCCSEHGFCGSTEDFCKPGCQSNCILRPTPPNVRKKSHVLNRVIGYYESWAASSPCHKMAVTDLPLSSLTHLNYAFGFIDPSTFEITPMDPSIPFSSFADVSAAKKYNPSLKVYISVGGWTFSDNGTVTQPIFGNIARSSANRKIFADNVVHFMKSQGYDGLDIDWEYPGAPDRGGSSDDVANFVALMKTLRDTFDQSGRDIGLSFTAPASYWYLRWFDLPGLLRYSDFVNVMTYDLHGQWDESNPIGPHILAHTNLTEIDLALQLFWRVGIPPDKISLGFGFYGRSFRLADSKCTTPGCPFAGTADPGPCSATGGILLYYEIMALLKQNKNLKPVWDKKAAVKYFVYAGNQWVSYDDADTFKQKIEYANRLGLSGSLIWASDTDDDKYTAHAGLIGSDPKHPDTSESRSFHNPILLAQNFKGQTGENCGIAPKACFKPDDEAMRHMCPHGTIFIGSIIDDLNFKCPEGKQAPICCPQNEMPGKCIWRGGNHGAHDCNGQCHTSEITLMTSRSGGSLPDSEAGIKRCKNGVKAFCCEASNWKNLNQGCLWTNCKHTECPAGLGIISRKIASCGFLNEKTVNFCCPVRKAGEEALYDCRWRGTEPDCADARCKANEVEIDRDPVATVGHGCLWGRYKVNCCKVRALPPPPVEPATCANYCDDYPEDCQAEDLGNDEAQHNSLATSDIESVGKRNLTIRWPDGREEKIYFNAQPPRSELFAGIRAGLVLNAFVHRIQGVRQCWDVRVDWTDIPDVSHLPDWTIKGHTEHVMDLNTLSQFIRSTVSGVLPSGSLYFAGTIPKSFWKDWFFKRTLPANFRQFNNEIPHRERPLDAVIDAFGSEENPRNFLLLEGSLNSLKGRLTAGQSLVGVTPLADAIEDIRANNLRRGYRVLNRIAESMAMYMYTQRSEFIWRQEGVITDLITMFRDMEPLHPQAQGRLVLMLQQFIPEHFRNVARSTQNMALNYLQAMEHAVLYDGSNQPTPRPLTRPQQAFLNAIQHFRDRVPNMFWGYWRIRD